MRLSSSTIYRFSFFELPPEFNTASDSLGFINSLWLNSIGGEYIHANFHGAFSPLLAHGAINPQANQRLPRTDGEPPVWNVDAKRS